MLCGVGLVHSACLAAADPSSPNPPNILFAIADDWSFGHAGVYGADWIRTPGFDRVATEGVLFIRAYTPNAKCAPSRACILTGRNSWQLEEAANHVPFFPAQFKSWMEALKDHGYSTGYTGKGWGPGVANDANGNRRAMTGQGYHKQKTTPPARHISNNDYSANFESFLSSIPRNEPWCFWYGALEPHRAYEFGAGTKNSDRSLNDLPRVPKYWPDNETVRQDILDYAFEVEYFDQHLVRMLELLEERGELNETLVVVTSDHGMPFPRAKGQAYDVSNHVPLAIMWKNHLKQPGRTVSDYVSFIDLAPTFLEVAGLPWEESGMASTPGHSLTEILFSSKSGRVNSNRDHVLIGKERHDVGRPHDWGYPIRGIVKEEFLYLQNFETDRWPAGNPETGYLNTDGSPTKTVVLDSRTDPALHPYWELCFGKRPEEELYLLNEDPDCIHNLAPLPQYQAVKSKLKKQLHSELKQQKDPRMFGRGEVFDNYPYANGGNKNFYERYRNGEDVRAGWVNPSDFRPIDNPVQTKPQ